MHALSKILIPLSIMTGVLVYPWVAQVGVYKEETVTPAAGTATLALPISGTASILHGANVAPANPQNYRVKVLSNDQIANASATIDALITEGLAAAKIKPLGKTQDEQFLRRVFLDLAGRIPTYEETSEFLENHKTNKRELLVKELLTSEAHVSHMFNWWADLLRANSRLQDRYSGLAYIDYIKQSIKVNKPFDKMVYELLMAEGPAFARGNGATGYYIADAGMPEDNMANTVRIFLGTRLACAQCHDHPFDKWTRRDFFEMAAFTEGTEVKADGNDLRSTVLKLAGKNDYGPIRVLSTSYARSVMLEVKGGTGGSIALPKDYQYKDAKPGQIISALTIFEESISKYSKTSARESYTQWMTSANNPRFALVVANRMWKKLMRVGFIEPLDDLTDETESRNKKLAEFLTNLMVSVKFDLRKFQEIICNTEAYQRQAISQDEDEFKFLYEGMPVRRLTAEQVWDSLMTLTIDDVDKINGEGAESLYKFYEENHQNSLQQHANMVINVAKSRQTIKDIRDEMNKIRGQMRKGGDHQKSQAKYDQLGKELAKLEATADIFSSGVRNSGTDLRRASELRSPMPPGHPLRVFGQSDRLVIQNSSQEMNLTQSLELMNGLVESLILGDNSSVLSKVLAKSKSPDDHVKMLFRAILSRMPTSSEQAFGSKIMSLAPNRRGPEYLGWTLINSAEFLFNQ